MHKNHSLASFILPRISGRVHLPIVGSGAAFRAVGARRGSATESSFTRPSAIAEAMADKTEDRSRASALPTIAWIRLRGLGAGNRICRRLITAVEKPFNCHTKAKKPSRRRSILGSSIRIQPSRRGPFRRMVGICGRRHTKSANPLKNRACSRPRVNVPFETPLRTVTNSWDLTRIELNLAASLSPLPTLILPLET